MKYSEIEIETARKICKQHRYKDNKTFKYTSDCDNCPLRRIRKDENGKEHTLYCYFTLMEIAESSKALAKHSIDRIEEEIEILKNEEVHKEKEIQRQIESMVK